MTHDPAPAPLSNYSWRTSAASVVTFGLAIIASLGVVFVFHIQDRLVDTHNTGAVVAPNTVNVLWTHRHEDADGVNNGKICLHGGRSFQIRTIDQGEPDVVVVQEILHGVVYNYEMVNIDELYAEHAEHNRTDQTWIDALVGIKYNCAVSPLSSIVGVDFDDDFDSSQPTFLGQKANGMNEWQVAHWIVEADQDGVPRVLRASHEYDDDFELEIVGVSDCASITVEGCDPDQEAGDEHLPQASPITEAMLEDSLRGHGRDLKSAESRQLLANLMKELSPKLTGTNWCGAGTPKNSPCPDLSWTSSIKDYDINADIACRRHDHGVKYTKVGDMINRGECINDRDLVYATNNMVVETIYGKYGVAGTWGCYSYGPYKCFKEGTWRWGNYCYGSKVRYGFTRYNNLDRHWGYHTPIQQCASDIWTCSGGNCETLCPKAPISTESQCPVVYT